MTTELERVIEHGRTAGQENRSCGTCAYFDPRKPGGGVNEDSGLCRFRGPTVGHVATMVPDESGETYMPTTQILTHWCAVKPDYDWCPDWVDAPRMPRGTTPTQGSESG